MTAWLRSVNCECLNCGEDPCDETACFCNLNLNTAGGDDGYSNIFDVTGEFPSDRDITVEFATYVVKDRLVITANGSPVYDSNCIATDGTPVSTTVTIPAGTTSVTVTVIPNCAGTTGTAWALSITCEPL